MNRRWWTLGIILIWAGAAATGCQQAQSGPVKVTPVAVYDLPITRTVTDYEEFPGQTDAIISVQVRARVSGYMTNVYFKDGSLIDKDDKLFEIDPRPYKASLDQARGMVAQYEAHVKRLEREYQRAKSLLGRGSVSQEEYDRYEADYRESVANLEVARANRDLAALNLEWTEIRSPTKGLLSRRMVDPGNLVKADDTALTSIVSLDPLYVYFDVHEQAMLKIRRLIQQGKVQARSEKEVPVQINLSDEDDFPHQGVVDFTDNRVDINTGTLRFRAKLSNPDGFITPGLFVRVRLPIGDPHPALLIREQALVTDQGRKTVFVVRDKKDDQGKPVLNDKREPVLIAMVRDVGTPGVLRDGFREIEPNRIQPDDRIVVSGMQRLRPGIEVKVEKFDERSPAGPGAAKKDASKPNASDSAAPSGATKGAPGGPKDAAEAVKPSETDQPPGRSLAPMVPTSPPGRGSAGSRRSDRGGH